MVNPPVKMTVLGDEGTTGIWTTSFGLRRIT